MPDETYCLQQLLALARGQNGSISVNSSGSSPFTPAAPINIGTSGSGAVPITMKQWTVLFFGTGTANSFMGGNITAPCTVSGTGFPTAPLPIVTDGSSTATVVGSTT